MEPLSHLFVLTCPNGKAASGAYRYSVYLSPRLRESGTLRDYNLWRNWGDRAGNVRFRAYNVNTATNLPVAIVSPPPDPAVWNAVFGTTNAAWDAIDVSPFAFVDRTSTDLLTYDIASIGNQFEALYAAAAAAGSGLDATALADALEDAPIGGSVIDGETFFGQHGNDGDPEASDAEFHQALRHLASHPDLLRRLGLVFDIEVNFPAGATPPEIQFRTNFPFLPTAGPPSNDFTSREQVPFRTQIDSNNEPEVRLPDYRTGRWVNFNDGKYEVGQGAETDIVAALGSLNGTGGASGEPVAVNEGGIRVMNVGVEELLIDQFEHSKEVNDDTDLWLQYTNDPDTGAPTQPPKIHAEDITVGIRWDAVDLRKGTFRSLHERMAPDGYSFPRSPAFQLAPDDSEGWSSLGVSTDGTAEYVREQVGGYPVQEGQNVPRFIDTDTTKWRADGSAVTWDGWSLSAGRPGRPIDQRGMPIDIAPNVPEPGDPAQVAVTYEAVPGSLERLRFDHTYRLRGRCVDLCGNSEPATSPPNNNLSSEAVEFGRTFPVVPPTVVRRSSQPVPGVGDFDTTIVIKSELDDRDRDIEPADRMLFPPRVVQQRLERHGLPKADGIDIADYQFIADRDALVLDDQLLADPRTGESVAGDTVVDGVVTPGKEKQVVQYMPDPTTTAMAFHDLPKGKSGKSLLMKTGTWPNPESVVLELAAGNRQPKATVSKRTVQVTLPKGTVVESRVSSPVDRKWLSHFRHYAQQPNSARNRTGAAMVAGQNATFSPSLRVKLVHAVRIPLLSPAYRSRWTGTRSEIGQTTTQVEGTLDLHRPTTDRAVLPATWDGPDLRTDPTGFTIGQVGSDILIDAVITDPGVKSQETKVTWESIDLDLLDTQRHNVTLTAEAFCRFSEYFTERRELSLTTGVEAVLDERGFDPSSVTITTAGGQQLSLADSFEFDAIAGTITPTDGNGRLDVQIDYIPLPISRLSAESRNGTTTTFLVPSSAPPPPPNVVRVLPAFSRKVKSTNSKITIDHDGRVVRVHMEAPWNVSGEGEMLAVAVETDGSQTQWGRDATVEGTGTRTQPRTSNFKKATRKVNNVDGGFDIAAHDVAYDGDRDLVTSDVQVNATFTYRPFVQLTLCRYQPEAISDAHVSTTVATDTLRLGAQRRVTVQRSGNDRVRVQLVGADNENQVTVRVEEADPDVTDVELRWQDSETSEVLNRTGTRRNSRHSGTVDLPAVAGRRIVIEDAEPVQRHTDAGLVDEFEVAYREVVEIPDTW